MNPSEIKMEQIFSSRNTIGEAKKAISPELAAGTERMEFEMT